MIFMCIIKIERYGIVTSVSATRVLTKHRRAAVVRGVLTIDN